MLGGMCRCCGGAFSHKMGCPETTAFVVGYCAECGEEITNEDCKILLNGNFYHEECAPDDPDIEWA